MSGKKLDQSLMEEIKAHTYKWFEFGCKDASYLVTKQEWGELSLSEKVLLRFHMATCKYCRRFVKQIGEIENRLKKSVDLSALKLADEKKLAINQLITQNLTKK